MWGVLLFERVCAVVAWMEALIVVEADLCACECSEQGADDGGNTDGDFHTAGGIAQDDDRGFERKLKGEQALLCEGIRMCRRVRRCARNTGGVRRASRS